VFASRWTAIPTPHPKRGKLIRVANDDKKADNDPNVDPLLLAKVFPEAYAVFSFRPKTLDEVFSTAVFILDTNALLVPYSLGKTSLDEIGKRYEELIAAKRLAVPAHVAREFANQRAEKIKNIYSALSRARNQSRPRTDYPVLVQMADHTELAKAEKAVDAVLATRNEALDRLLAQIRSWRWDDPVSELYRRSFTAEVVVESEFKDARADAKERLDGRIPPGYKDAGKPVNASGDVLAWHSVLELGKKRPEADVIFISGDEKNDWFYRSEGTPLYPRFELTDEYRRASRGGSFHIMTFADFLKRSNAPAAVVDEVRVQEVLSASDRPKHHWGFLVETAVARWLTKKGYSLHSRASFPDFMATKSGGETVGVEVKLVSSRPLWSEKMKEIVARSSAATGYEKLMAFFVALDKRQAEMAYSNIGGSVLRDARERPIEVIVGYIRQDGDLELIDG
jgi:rRNA-processing protein FCF1